MTELERYIVDKYIKLLKERGVDHPMCDPQYKEVVYAYIQRERKKHA